MDGVWLLAVTHLESDKADLNRPGLLLLLLLLLLFLLLLELSMTSSHEKSVETVGADPLLPKVALGGCERSLKAETSQDPRLATLVVATNAFVHERKKACLQLLNSQLEKGLTVLSSL